MPERQPSRHRHVCLFVYRLVCSLIVFLFYLCVERFASFLSCFQINLDFVYASLVFLLMYDLSPNDLTIYKNDQNIYKSPYAQAFIWWFVIRAVCRPTTRVVCLIYRYSGPNNNSAPKEDLARKSFHWSFFLFHAHPGYMFKNIPAYTQKKKKKKKKKKKCTKNSKIYETKTNAFILTFKCKPRIRFYDLFMLHHLLPQSTPSSRRFAVRSGHWYFYCPYTSYLHKDLAECICMIECHGQHSNTLWTVTVHVLYRPVLLWWSSKWLLKISKYVYWGQGTFLREHNNVIIILPVLLIVSGFLFSEILYDRKQM